MVTSRHENDCIFTIELLSTRFAYSISDPVTATALVGCQLLLLLHNVKIAHLYSQGPTQGVSLFNEKLALLKRCWNTYTLTFVLDFMQLCKTKCRLIRWYANTFWTGSCESATNKTKCRWPNSLRSIKLSSVCYFSGLQSFSCRQTSQLQLVVVAL